MSTTDHNRVAIVTGAASGLGESIAMRLLEEGYRVVAADLDATFGGLESIAREDALVTAQADIGDPTTGERLVALAVREFGRLDAVVNNAATGGPGTSVVDTPISDFTSVFNINILGAVRLIQAAVPKLTESSCARIVNLGSVFGQQPVTNGASYCMSKAAIHTLSQCLALELGANGITVNSVAPGYMMTKMHESEIELQAGIHGVTFDEQAAKLRSTVPVQRHGTGEDVADTVAWLLSPGASYITAQTIGVNGGIHPS